MGSCLPCHSKSTTAGSQIALPQVSWDGGGFDGLCHGLEVGGIPLMHFLSQFSGLGPAEQSQVASTVVQEVEPPSAPAGDSEGNPARGFLSSRPSRGICHRRPVRVGLLSWNVGGISDNRKEHGAGIHKSSRADVMKVLAAAVRDMGEVDIIVVGLQETISLNMENAMKVMSSAGDSRRNRQFYGWPTTVAQWVELLLGGLNSQPQGLHENRPENESENEAWFEAPGDDQDHHSFALYGQPVYLFGLLLCVCCRTDVLKYIKDFGMVEKAMDSTFNAEAFGKGVVACRFVLFDRSFCFINCHLTAQKGNNLKYNHHSFLQRLLQIQRIWAEVKFKSQIDQMVYPVSAHRAVFLLGDTNFRLSPQHRWYFQHKSALTGSDPNGDDMLNYCELWGHDELQQELRRLATTEQQGRMNSRTASCRMASSRSGAANSSSVSLAGPEPSTGSAVMSSAPSGSSRQSSGQSTRSSLFSISASLRTPQQALRFWREPVVSMDSGPPFPPTFKLGVPGPGYSQKRVPAWTDRVLFRSMHAKPLEYGCVQQAKVLSPARNISDHNPVFARFEVDCVTVHTSKLAQLVREVRGSRPTQAPLQEQQQALAFQAHMMEIAQPEIEDLGRRLFADLQELGSADAAIAGANQVLEFQEECWHLMCTNLQSMVMASIRKSCVDRGLPLDSTVVDTAMQETLASLRRTVSV